MSNSCYAGSPTCSYQAFSACAFPLRPPMAPREQMPRTRSWLVGSHGSCSRVPGLRVVLQLMMVFMRGILAESCNSCGDGNTVGVLAELAPPTQLSTGYCCSMPASFYQRARGRASAFGCWATALDKSERSLRRTPGARSSCRTINTIKQLKAFKDRN